MIDRSRAFALLLAATLLILGAGAHAVMGWIFVREALEALPAKAGLMGVLSAGWQLGSVSLLAFGLLALVAGLACWRRQPVAPASVGGGFGSSLPAPGADGNGRSRYRAAAGFSKVGAVVTRLHYPDTSSSTSLSRVTATGCSARGERGEEAGTASSPFRLYTGAGGFTA